jgi:ribosome biogenesis protein Nip4
LEFSGFPSVADAEKALFGKNAFFDGASSRASERSNERSLTLSLSAASRTRTKKKQRVYYVREDIMKRATSVARDQLVSLGVCVGKFTHSDKFRLTIGALELLAAHAKHKVSYAAAFGETYRFVAKQRVFFRRRRFFFFSRAAPRRSPGDASHFSLQPEPL